jgi:ribosomal protein L2
MVPVEVRGANIAHIVLIPVGNEASSSEVPNERAAMATRGSGAVAQISAHERQQQREATPGSTGSDL